MKKKSTNHHSSRPAMSPLLRALTFSRSMREPMTSAMLLQGYTALDAFQRGHGSHALFMTLCRQLLVAEELCGLGHASASAQDIANAHEALVAVAAHHTDSGNWTLDASAYTALCDALAIFAMQLDDASLDHIAQAEASMVTQSLLAANSHSKTEQRERELATVAN